MKSDEYQILDRPFSSLLELEKLAVWKIRKWVPYSKGLYPSEPPTSDSLKRIEQQLGLIVPPVYVDLARIAPNYGVWFGSIGPDFDSHNHILQLNAAFHQEDEGYTALPSHFVLINHGHDGDCDCWNLEEKNSCEHPIYYMNVERESVPRLLSTTFLDYWKNFA